MIATSLVLKKHALGREHSWVPVLYTFVDTQALKCRCYGVSRPGKASDIMKATNLKERIPSFCWDSQTLCLPLRPNARLVAVAGLLCYSDHRRAPGSCTTAEGSAFTGLPSCCHNVVMISGRHNPDCLNEKAISDLGFLVNAQVYEGEIRESCLLGIIIQAKHHLCNLLWKVELVFLFTKCC